MTNPTYAFVLDVVNEIAIYQYKFPLIMFPVGGAFPKTYKLQTNWARRFKTKLANLSLYVLDTSMYF